LRAAHGHADGQQRVCRGADQPVQLADRVHLVGRGVRGCRAATPRGRWRPARAGRPAGTATLYRHFGNRAALITQVVDRVFGDIDLDPDTLAGMPWDHACRVVAQTMFDALGRHPKIAPLLIEQTPTGPNAMVLRERCLAVLLAGGLPPNLAARAYATLARYVLGFAVQLTGSGDDTERDRVSTHFHDLPSAQFPATLAVADSLPVPLADEFAFGLDLIITGLRQLPTA
jgi:AcrR family transcriptional regulator